MLVAGLVIFFLHIGVYHLYVKKKTHIYKLRKRRDVSSVLQSAQVYFERKCQGVVLENDTLSGRYVTRPRNVNSSPDIVEFCIKGNDNQIVVEVSKNKWSPLSLLGWFLTHSDIFQELRNHGVYKD